MAYGIQTRWNQDRRTEGSRARGTLQRSKYRLELLAGRIQRGTRAKKRTTKETT